MQKGCLARVRVEGLLQGLRRVATHGSLRLEARLWDTGVCVGAWRSLVARAVRVGEVPGSNPGAPIGFKNPRISANAGERPRKRWG